MRYVPQSNSAEMEDWTGQPSDLRYLQSPSLLVEQGRAPPMDDIAETAQFESMRRDDPIYDFRDEPRGPPALVPAFAFEPTTAPLNIGRHFFSSIRPDGAFEVLSTGTVNAADFVQKDRTTVICADTIRIVGNVTTAGRALGLYCRHMVFEPGSKIDTRGADASPPPPPPLPMTGSGIGGLSGADGNGGQPGGHLTICATTIAGVVTIDTRGGAGGLPQQGGNGSDGQHGVPGRNSDGVTRYIDKDPPASAPYYCDARWGDSGGDGGSPGRRGKGGRGGDVFVHVVAPVTGAQIKCEHGPHSPVGLSGKPGKGGNAAPAGRFFYRLCTDVTVPGDKPTIECGPTQELVGRSAPDMADGQPVVYPYASEEPKGENGAKILKHDAHQKIADGTNSGPWIEMLSWAIDEAYRLNGGELTPDLAQKVDYLWMLCTRGVAIDDRKRAVGARLSALKIQASLGLDFYGYSIEDAPLLSIDTYSALVATNLLPGLKALEDSFRVLSDAAASEAARKSALRTALDQAVVLERELGRLFEKTMAYALEINANVERLDAEAREAERVLRKAQAELEAAIQRATNSGGCTAETVLATAVSVYVVVTSAGTAWTAAAGMVSALQNARKFFDTYAGMKQIMDNWKILKEDLDKIKSDKAKLDEAIAEIGEQLQGKPPSPDRLPDFVMQKAEFDRIADQFMNLPEAASFREAGYWFLDVSQARLQAIVDYNACVARLAEIEARRVEAVDGKKRAESELNRVGNPALREAYFAVGQMLESALQAAGSAVHRERKALAYHMNQPERAPSSQMNVATLTHLHQQTTERWLAFKEAFNPQLPVNPHRLEINVLDFVDGTSSEAWARFVNEGILGFSIRYNHPSPRYRMFKSLPALRFTGLKVAIVGAKVLEPGVGPVEGDIYWKMELGGIEQVYPEKRPPVRFRHKALRIGGSSAQSGVFGEEMIFSNFGGDGLYAGLSPFTQWRLVLNRDENLPFDQQYDLSAVSSVKMQLLATVSYAP